VSDLGVRLRPVSADDLPLLELMANDREQAGELSWAGFVAPGRLRQRLEDDGFLGREGGRLMVVVDDETVGLVSWIRVFHGAPPSRSWNMGAALLPSHRGRGIGSEAQRQLVEYLFQVTDYVRVEAGTLTDNIGEQRALEKVGFTREGVLRSAQFINGAWRDVVLFSRLRTD
jgi:RimJ/RimL family protein N-acetyltransferase